MADQTGALGVIAGSGALPRLIAEGQAEAGAPYLVISFIGGRQDWMAGHPHAEAAFEKPARLFRTLRDGGCDRVVFAGAMTRPSLAPWKYDLKAWSYLRRVPALLRKGDDAMLTGLAQIFEEEGFQLVGAQEFLGAHLAPEGVLGSCAPTARDKADAEKAGRIAEALGAVDVGQAVVVGDGLCLGVEAIEGTDALLDRVASLPKSRRPKVSGPVGVLWKAPKRGQDRRMDLPAIGVETVRRAAEARLSAIVVEAGGVFILDLAEAVAEADRRRVAIWGRPATASHQGSDVVKERRA
jgi:DUF1009 family protein